MQSDRLKGRAAYIFAEADFDVDQICGVENILVQDIDVLVKCAMRSYDPQFSGSVRRGDFLIGGPNFGYGHPHYQGMRAMRHLGIAAVIAESFSPGYWRGEISMGFLQVPCPGVLDLTERWDELEIDLSTQVVRNLRTDRKIAFEPIPEWDMKVIEAGGFVEFLRQHVQ